LIRKNRCWGRNRRALEGIWGPDSIRPGRNDAKELTKSGRDGEELDSKKP